MINPRMHSLLQSDFSKRVQEDLKKSVCDNAAIQAPCAAEARIKVVDLSAADQLRDPLKGI